MQVFHFRLRQPKTQHVLSGFATEVDIRGGRILLKDRRIPWTITDGSDLSVCSHRLGDLELSGDHETGWFAWAFPVQAPAWWDRVELPMPAK